MTILVTGGFGFIGSNFILDWFSTSTEGVVNLDKMTYAANPKNLEAIEGSDRYRFVRASIRDTSAILELLRRSEIRAIVNFAAESHVDRSISGPEPFFETNVLGTLGLLEAARLYSSELRDDAERRFRFLHVSTDEVFGSLAAGAPAFTEDHPFRPNSPYAASKAASDHLVRAYHETHGLPTLTTNCSNNYGPFHFPEKLIPLFIHNALSGRQLPLYGDGLQVRDWLYVKDHCSAIRRVLDAGRVGETYNVGGGQEKTNLEVATILCSELDELQPAAHGRSYAAQMAFVRDRPGHDRRYAIDAGKIQRELGWAPVESFESGIRKTVQWYLGNPQWVAEVTSGAYREWIERQYA